MRRFTTFAQHRILKFYWAEHLPFTLRDLTDKGIFHLPLLGRISLRLMESRGQIIVYNKRNGENCYIGTTESRDEWKKIWRSEDFSTWHLRGRNRYEKARIITKLNELIVAYKLSDTEL